MSSIGWCHLALNKVKVFVQVPLSNSLWAPLPRRHPTFSPVPGKLAAAWMQSVIAHWLRHTDKLIWRWKWGWKRCSLWVWICFRASCTDLRGSLCFTNMTCICMFKIIYVLLVYSSLLFQGINCPMLWKDVFAWKNRCLENYVSTTSEVVSETLTTVPINS